MRSTQCRTDGYGLNVVVFLQGGENRSVQMFKNSGTVPRSSLLVYVLNWPYFSARRFEAEDAWTTYEKEVSSSLLFAVVSIGGNTRHTRSPHVAWFWRRIWHGTFLFSQSFAAFNTDGAKVFGCYRSFSRRRI